MRGLVCYRGSANRAARDQPNQATRPAQTKPHTGLPPHRGRRVSGDQQGSAGWVLVTADNNLQPPYPPTEAQVHQSPWYVRWLIAAAVVVALLLFFMPNRDVASGAKTVAQTFGTAFGIVVFSIPRLVEGVFDGKDYMETKPKANERAPLTSTGN